MDAVEFLKAAERRMKSNPEYYGEFIDLRRGEWISLVAKVEDWSKRNPIKTRQSEFLKMFPNAPLREGDGYLNISPCELDTTKYNEAECARTICASCRKKYWMQEVK